MSENASVAFFDRQFREQLARHDFQLNPFELAVLPHLHGRVLDFGCGMGNLAIAAATQGCTVRALDASPTAIAALHQRALAGALPIEAVEADLRDQFIAEQFDCAVSIGLLCYFDCATARRTLAKLKNCVRPGGIAAINVLIEGTTWLSLVQADDHCLFARNELEQGFANWEVLMAERRDYPAPEQTLKSFDTVIARKLSP